MTGDVTRTWTDGVAVDCSDDEWAALRAGFLGAGFRVVVPSGPDRPAALARARDLAARVAERLRTRLDETPWRHLASEVRDPGPGGGSGSGSALEVVGGWTHRFRASSGPCSTRVTAWTVPTVPTVPTAPTALPGTEGSSSAPAPGVTLPWQVNIASPLTGLPALSGHHEARAEAWLRPGEVGIWSSATTALVDTTAGAPLLRTPRGWLHPVPHDGTVPHHLWERACARLQADAWSGELPHDLDAVLCVAPDGRLTHLTALDGVPLSDRPAVDTALDRLR